MAYTARSQHRPRCVPAGGPGPHALYLPPLHSVVGVELEVYVDTAMTSETLPRGFEWHMSQRPGISAGRWAWTPTATGTYPLTLTQCQNGRAMGSTSTTVEVTGATTGDALTIACIGDSLTAEGLWVDSLAAFLSDATFVGTLATSPGGRAHDGWSGSSATTWTTSGSSPLAGGAPAYITELGATPDVVVIMLGINHLVTPSEAAWKAAISTELAAVEVMVGALQGAGVTSIVLALTTPGNAMPFAWGNSYGEEDHADPKRWKLRHRHQLPLQVAAWGGREPQRVYLAAAVTAVNPVAGYPDGNALHLNTGGYAQIAPSIYAAISRATGA